VPIESSAFVMGESRQTSMSYRLIRFRLLQNRCAPSTTLKPTSYLAVIDAADRVVDAITMPRHYSTQGTTIKTGFEYGSTPYIAGLALYGPCVCIQFPEPRLRGNLLLSCIRSPVHHHTVEVDHPWSRSRNAEPRQRDPFHGTRNTCPRPSRPVRLIPCLPGLPSQYPAERHGRALGLLHDSWRDGIARVFLHPEDLMARLAVRATPPRSGGPKIAEKVLRFSDMDATQPYVDVTRPVGTLVDLVVSFETTLRSLAAARQEHYIRRVKGQMDLVNETLPPDKRAEALKGMEPAIARSLEATEILIVNWGVGTLWSAFEGLLEDVLVMWFTRDPRAFLPWGGEMSAKFQDITECESVDAVRKQYFQKAVKNFTSETIEKRIKLLEKHLNARPEILFSTKQATPEIKALLGQFDVDAVRDISENRNKVVHNNEYPYKKVDELQRMEVVLEWLLRNIAALIGSRLGVPVQLMGIQLPPIV